MQTSHSKRNLKWLSHIFLSKNDTILHVKKKYRVCVLVAQSCVCLFATLWTIAHQASQFMGFSRQEYWNGLPCPPPGALPNTGIKLVSPGSPALQVNSLLMSQPGKPTKVYMVTD